MLQVHVQSFFDTATSTFSHVIHESGRAACAVVDPVLGFDGKSGRIDTQFADAIADYVEMSGLEVHWLLETHVHADHLSAAHYLRRRLGGRIGISDRLKEVRQAFADVFEPGTGEPFDHLFAPDEAFTIGNLRARALAVPGHTPADMAFQVDGEHVFVGDTLFPPDVGTARCDFPGGSAAQMYRSIRRLLDLPAATQLYLCHDYPPEGREPRARCTVAEQRAANIHVGDGIDEASFVALRSGRDSGLSVPLLFLPSIQVNLRAGLLPVAEQNGVRYLRIPLDRF